MTTPTNWDDAAADALDNIYHGRSIVRDLDNLRWHLDEFINAEYRADANTPHTAKFWQDFGTATLRVAEKKYPDARKYLTQYDVHALLIKKQHDYGHENIRRFGRDGLLVRVHDKVARLENLTAKNVEPENETIIDTFADIIGYSAIGMMVANDTFMLPLDETLTNLD